MPTPHDMSNAGATGGADTDPLDLQRRMASQGSYTPLAAQAQVHATLYVGDCIRALTDALYDLRGDA